MSSTPSSPNSETDNSVVDSENTDITDAAIKEIENLLPSDKKTLTPHQLRLKEAAQHLLKRSSGIISTVFLEKSIDNEAASLLVDDCLFIYTDDLFEDRDYVNPEGFIKYVPDTVDLVFISRLVRYGIDPTLYIKDITLPEVWKSRLSANGIRLLRTMEIYRNMLDSIPPPSESPSNIQPINYLNNEKNENSSSISHDQPLNQQSQNVTQHDQEETFSIPQSSRIMEPLNSTNDQPHQCRDAIHKSNSASNNIENNFDNPNNKRLMSTIDDSNNTTFDKQTSKKKCRPQNDNDCLVMQPHHPSPSVNKPIMNWNLLRKRMIGLTNKDSITCYINAALQCLASTPPLVDWLFDQLDKSRTCQLSNQGKFCSVCELTKVVCSIHPSSRNKTIVSNRHSIPTADFIRQHIHLISPIFNSTHQQDVSEFIIIFLDHCITCLSSHLSIPAILPLTPTIIDQIFAVKLLSSVQCLSCLCTTHTEDVTNTLVLEIDNLNNLTDALAHFVDRETLDKFICSNCGKSVNIYKRVTIDELSPILMIYFKRCAMSFDSSEKLLHQVNFNELLDLSPYTTSHFITSNNENQNINSSNDNIYKLYAIINHVGNDLERGHYYSYIRSSDNLWFLVDDAHCRPVSPNEVFNHPQAVLLFYGKAYHTSTDTNPSFQQQQQSLTYLPTENNNVLYSSSIFNSSIVVNPTSTNQSIMLRNEQLLSNKSLIDTTKMMSSDHFENQSKIKLKSKNTLSTVTPRRNIILNTEPLPGQTESTITIGNKCSNDRIKEKRKNINHISNKDLSRQSTSYTKFSSFSNDISDDSVAEVSDREETGEETCKKLASVATGVPIERIFEDTLAAVYKFRLNETELIKLNQLRQQELKKISDRKMKMMGLAPDPSSFRRKQSKNGTISTTINNLNDDESYKKNQDISTSRKVNIEYLYLLLPHLKHYNAACALCIRTRYFGKNISNATSVLLKCTLKCSGQDCNFKCVVYVLNDGTCCVGALNRKIFHHVAERLSRPIRGSRRQAIKDKFKSGGSVYRIHAQYDKQRTINEKKGFNYDSTGKSKKIFKKIKAEATADSLLSPDITLGILQLHDQLANEINNEGIIKGALQLVQLRPFCIVAFTEASIRLYDILVSHPESVLSWDATGGIIKNTASTSKQCLYYELTISHPNVITEDTLVPLSFMLSESQTLLTVTNWLTTFKENHKKVFPHKKDSFPRPAVILSDRAQIFLQAGLRVFNNENYHQFLARAYRIVTNQAIENDLSKTNIHACLSHFMLDMRKRVNKYLPYDIRELAMWCVALLVNTNTWNEMKENWRLICEVFLNYSTNETINYKINYSILLTRISQITNDPNSSAAINQSEQTLSELTDPFEFDDDIENDNLDYNQLHSIETIETTTKAKRSNKSHAGPSAVNKSIIDEEKQLNQINSNFKQDLQKIYNECYENSVKSTASSSSTDKTNKSTRQWLAYFNQHCIPTVAIWSNLLLGNLTRHGTASIQAYEKLLLTTHDQRTNAISERRMSIVKRTQLGTQTYMRSDVVLQILTEDMQKMIENFAISYMGTTSADNNNEIYQHQLKELKENWKQKNRRGHGYYSKKPETSVMNNLKYSLVASSTLINDGLSIPHLPVVNWLNVAIGLLISIKSIRESIPLSSIMTTPLLTDILSFIDKWISSLNRIKPPKKTSTEQIQLLNTEFHMPIDVPTGGNEQLNFILQNILLPIIDHSIPAIKIYCCTSCKFTVHTRFDISYIPINIVEEQFQLRRQLNNYFNGCTSDHLCDKCSMAMSRHIKLLDCPSVVILNINHINTPSMILHRPPGTICFQSFLEKSNVGCSSSSIYDVVAFLSIIPNTDNKLVLATKINQRWRISSMTKLVGNGEKLCKLFANSRLIILERVRTCDSNFIYAIAQCCSYAITDIEENNFKICKTLRDAVKIIESEPIFSNLCDILTSHFTTYYQCQKCRCSPNSLSTTHKCISLYEPHTELSTVCATPLVWQGTIDLHCSVCNEITENVILPTNTQVHYQFPSVLMYHLSHTTFHAVIDLRIELTDYNTQHKYVYQPSSVLLIDEYNAISVIKLQNLLIYCTNPYQTATTLSNDAINELFYTAQTIIVFLQHVHTNQTTFSSIDTQQINNQVIDHHSSSDSQSSDNQQTINEEQIIETITNEKLPTLSYTTGNELVQAKCIASSTPKANSQIRIDNTINSNQALQQPSFDLETSSVLESGQQSVAAATSTTILFKSPLPVRLVNTSTSTSVLGAIHSLTIPQKLSINSSVNDTTHRST